MSTGFSTCCLVVREEDRVGRCGGWGGCGDGEGGGVAGFFNGVICSETLFQEI